MMLASWLIVRAVAIVASRERAQPEPHRRRPTRSSELQERSRTGVPITCGPSSRPRLHADARSTGPVPSWAARPDTTPAGSPTSLGDDRGTGDIVDAQMAGRSPARSPTNAHVSFVGGPDLRLHARSPCDRRPSTTPGSSSPPRRARSTVSVHTLKTTLWWAVPGLVVAHRRDRVGRHRPGAAAGRDDPHRGHRHQPHHARPAGLGAARAGRGRPARPHDERDARPAPGHSSDRQRQFVSDASHELRSPVAAIRATGEVALAHPDAADWPIVVRRMLTEDDRMEQIVDDLLELARGRGDRAARHGVDLDDVVLDEVDARPAQRHRRSRPSAVSAGRVRGSREQLTRVVRNLLDNATVTRPTVRISLGTPRHPSANGTGPAATRPTQSC